MDQGFCQSGDGGISAPPQLEFFGEMFFLVLKILITLSVMLRHLEAELSILMCLKLIRGVISTYRKKNIYFKKNCYPLKFFLVETLWTFQLTS
jgi:DMSO reductase anchor subunit